MNATTKPDRGRIIRQAVRAFHAEDGATLATMTYTVNSELTSHGLKELCHGELSWSVLYADPADKGDAKTVDGGDEG